MVRNSLKSETRERPDVVAAVASRLPAGWRAVARSRNLDVTAPDGTNSTFRIETLKSLEARDVRSLVERLKAAGTTTTPIVTAPYLGPRTRELLTEAAVGYLDATGNTRISLSKPAIFISTTGADRDPNPPQRPLRSLRGPGAARAVRALCETRASPLGVRHLAQRMGASAPTLSRVIQLLEREALLERDRRGAVESVDVAGVVRRWARDYSFAGSNRVSTYLDPRGLEHFRAKLASKSKELAHAATGSLAASEFVTIAPSRLAQVFVPDAVAAARDLGLRETDAGANVILAEPYDDVVFVRTLGRGGLRCAALPQVAADLLTSPGRAPAEGEALLAWMVANEGAWRT